MKRGMHGGAVVSTIVDFIKGNIEAGSVVADIGCGTGRFTSIIAPIASLVYCVDSSEDAINEARRSIKLSNVVFLNENADSLSIPDHSVDVVLLAFSFHDMANKESVVGEIKRVIKPSGKVIIVDWVKEKTPIGPPLEIRLSEEDYVNAFKEFKPLQVSRISQYHYGIVLKAPEL
ncbi:class I SAM-dependent methyltransferase [Caldivirga sp.]|jgi:ubiquinone/menaquinone biosynthesis C-methylase UbiE|uniref:class I SAM-dependent methyltransferase n=1 Tax=Caldivirga sp. TaxID=2080243 RepID=UPI003D0C4C0D